jgi:hypothetical protein
VARKPRRPPFSIRFSDEQRANIDSRADLAGLSIGGYVLTTLFNTPPPRQSRRPTADRQLLAEILTAFRHSHIGGNINQLAKAANEGSWPDSRLVKQACDDIRMIRDMLIRALGFTPPDDPPAP